MKLQRGGLVLGLILGLLVGLGLALAVALYVTKAPIPFVNKVPQRTAEQDAAEAARNRDWDPNAPLAGKPAALPKPADPVAAAPTVPPGALPPGITPAPGAWAPPPATVGGAPAARSNRDPAAILAGASVAGTNAAGTNAAGGTAQPVPPALTPAASAARSAKPEAEPFIYFVQAGAFQGSEEAEQQRARLALMGLEPKVIEREQSGRTVFRVRLGPYQKQEQADATKDKLSNSGVEAVLVRINRSTP